MSQRWAASVAMAQNASGGPARTAPTATFDGGYLLNTPGGQYENKATAAQIIEKRQSGEGWEGDKGAAGVIISTPTGQMSNGMPVFSRQTALGTDLGRTVNGPLPTTPLLSAIPFAKPSLLRRSFAMDSALPPIPKFKWGNPYNSEPIYPIQ